VLSRVALVVAAAAALLVVPAAQPAAEGTPFFFGFTEDIPKEIGSDAVAPAAALGAKAFRITLMWSPGQTQLTAEDAGKLDRAVNAAAGMRVVLAVYADAASKAPQTDSARDEYCGYVRNVLDRYPSLRDVVVWNEPNKSFFWSPQAGAPAAYQALAARCWDVLHGAFSGVNVIGPVLSPIGFDNSGSTSPGAFIRDLGQAYRASGRQSPILDTIGHHAYGMDAGERPWRKHIQSKWISHGDWNKLMYNLWLAFDGTAQPIPGDGATTIWYLESGSQTAIDAGKEGVYTGTENVQVVPDYAGGEPDGSAPSETSDAPDQYTQALDAIRLAYCQPHVATIFNFLLFDEPRLEGWQSAPFWADRTRKDSYPAFAQAIGEANAGTVNCDALKGGRPSADFMPPSAPAGLAGTAERDPLRVVLTWQAATDDASAISYRVYRNGAHVANTGETTWTNTNVASATTYTYTVRAIDSAGNLGDASDPVTVTTPDVTPPSVPADLAATPQPNPARVEVTWTAAADNVGVAGYEVFRDGALAAQVAGLAYTDTAVVSNTTYGYAVVALDAAGNRSAAATVSVTTGDLVAPSTPGGLTAVGRTSPLRVDLAWPASTDDVGVAGYEVLRDDVLLATVTGTSYSDTAVQSGRSYRYAVRAVDAAGNRSGEAGASATAPDVVAPSAPANLRADSLSHPPRVRLTWAAASDDVGVAGYRIYRNGVLIASTANLSYTDSSVARSTWYRYDVRTYDAAGNLGPASTVSVKTAKR
jgi:fibronectin type 3 domain-containing protein